MAYTITFTINALPTIQEILDSDLSFLDHSTQKRNIAYLIQLENMLSQLTFKKGLESMHRLNILRLRADIIEGLLYCALDQSGVGTNVRKAGVINYSNKAKGRGLISTISHQKIKKIADKRNNFHPGRQIDLHVKIDPEILEISNSIIKDVLPELQQRLI